MKSKLLLKSLFLLWLLFIGVSVHAQYPNEWSKNYQPFATGDGMIVGTTDAGYYLDKDCASLSFYKFNGTTWSAAANMPATCPLFAMGIGTKLYVGFRNGTFYYYDSADQIWHASGNYTSSFSNCGLMMGTYLNPAVAINGKGYLITSNAVSTGSNTCTGGTIWSVWEYNPAGNTWTNKTTVPLTVMSQRESVALFTVNKKLYTGFGDPDTDPSLWSWDPTTNAWLRATDNYYGSYGGVTGVTGVETCDNAAYLFGGTYNSSNVMKYIPSSDTWMHWGPFVDHANGVYTQALYLTSFTLNNKAYLMTSISSPGYIWESSTILELTTSVPSTTICTKTNFNVTYNTNCTYLPGNVFTAQLSDANGSFNSPTVIGTLISTTAGTIAATMPSITAGTGYRVRVVSSSPYKVGTDNGVNINVIRTANVSFTTGATVAYLDGPPITLSGGIPAGGTYSGPGVTGGTTFNPALAGLGTHTITYTYNQCSPTAINKITVTNCTSTTSVGNWVTQAPFPGQQRIEAVSFTIGNISYVGTGQSYGETATRLKDLWAYNSATNTWTQKESIPLNGIRSGAFCFVIGTKAYVGGGSLASGTYLRDFWEYNSLTDRWTQKANLPFVVAYSAAFSMGTDGYVFGGYGNATVYDQLWKWNGNSWSTVNTTGAKPSARYDAVGFSIGSKGYVSTGSTTNTYLNDLWEYNPSSLSWTQKADFPGVARKNAVATVIGSQVVLGLGGILPVANSAVDVYTWSQTTQSWSPIPDFPQSRMIGSTAFTSQNSIYVTTGVPMSTLWKYTFNCDPVISINYTPNTIFCAGGPTFYLSASALGTFNAGNVFSAQLSDENGVFGTNPLVIGTYAASSFMSFPVSIPSTVLPGTNYRMRIVSSNPVVTSITTSAPTTINSCSIQTGTIVSPICGGSTIVIPFTATGFPVGSDFMVELSNASGGFDSGTTSLGYAGGTGSVSTNVYIPPNYNGTQYRIRIRQNQSNIVGADNGVDLTISNTCASLTFDGVDDKVVIPNHNNYQIGNGDFTIAAWVKLSTTLNPAALYTIVSKRNSNFEGFSFGVTNGDKVFYKNAFYNTYYSGSFSSSIYDDRCHFVAVSRQAGVLTFSIDGTPMGSPTDAASWNCTADMTLGMEFSGNPFSGQMNDVRIYNIGLTPAQINSTKNSTPSSVNLIAFYNFKEIGVQTITDGTANANHGYLGSDMINVDANDPQRTGVSCYQWDRVAFAPEETVENVSVKMYPNPFEESLTLEVEGFSGDYIDVSFMDLSGRVVQEFKVKNKVSVTLSPSLAKGIYIVKVKDASDHYVYHKLIRN